MTVQVEDLVMLRGEEFCLIQQCPIVFSPIYQGIKTYWNCTACYNGYQNFFSVGDDGLLVLDKVLLNAKDPGSIMGVDPVFRHAVTVDGGFTHSYDLRKPLPYDGKLRLARGYVEEEDVPRAPSFNYAIGMYEYEMPWEDVRALCFEKGILKEEKKDETRRRDHAADHPDRVQDTD